MAVRASLLKTFPFFADLSESELSVIIQFVREVHYPKASIVFYEGDSADSLLLIVSGKVKVVLLGEQGQETILKVLASGSFFGELSLIEDGRRSATVITLEKATFLQLQRDAFLTAVQANPAIAMRILKQLAARVRELSEEIRSLTMFDIYGKAVRCLIQLAQSQGIRKNGVILVAGRPSNQDIARMIGCTRESVSRAMKVLQENQYLILTSAGIQIKQRALKQYWPSL
jgi:CRP/FNR family transcriptional regulator, cyclic AMP receptor protein